MSKLKESNKLNNPMDLMRELNDALKSREYREMLLNAVNKAAEVLLTTSEEDTLEALMTGMEIVGLSLDVDRVQIWRNEVIDGNLCFVMRYEWLSEVGEEKIEVPIGLICSYDMVPEWYNMFLQGGYINGPISQLPKSEASFLGYYEMVSIVNYPLFLNNEFIGFFSVDDCRNERVFTENEMSLIASAGLMLTSVFNRVQQSSLQKELDLERQNNKIAKESNKAKSRFLARMSHEIRTPITAILGISEIQLYNEDLPPQIESSFEKIHGSATMLLHIINDILDLSKIEAEKMELHVKEYGVASIINDLANMCFVFSGESAIRFKLNVDENIPATLKGDSLRIKQILINLLSNAFKYTKFGSVEMSWTFEKSSDKKNIVLVVSIKDTGLGMTPEQLDLLYASGEYTRFHERENQLISGTGLGMPIVFNLAKMMNTTIKFESEVGKGTTVIVRIPQPASNFEKIGADIVPLLHQFDKDAHSSAKRRKITPEPMPYGRILVVDDVDANIDVMYGLLSFYSLKVESCSSGKDAINKVKEGNVYDIIFMDQMMPALSGTETLQVLRIMGYHHPVIVLTADAVTGREEEYIKSGFDSFITKPVAISHLNNALIKYVKDKQPPEVIEAAKANKPQKVMESIEDFQNNPDLINRLQLSFVRNHKNTMVNLNKALKKKDTEVAHFIVHALKGSAGTIKETALGQLAEQLTILLKSGKTPTSNKLTAFETELNNVLNKINKPEATKASANVDKTVVVETLNEIKPLLEFHSPKCLKLADKLRGVPETSVLIKMIESFEFEKASDVLSVLQEIYED